MLCTESIPILQMKKLEIVLQINKFVAITIGFIFQNCLFNPYATEPGSHQQN